MQCNKTKIFVMFAFTVGRCFCRFWIVVLVAFWSKREYWILVMFWMRDDVLCFYCVLIGSFRLGCEAQTPRSTAKHQKHHHILPEDLVQNLEIIRRRFGSYANLLQFHQISNLRKLPPREAPKLMEAYLPRNRSTPRSSPKSITFYSNFSSVETIS